jgi:hypothetical protein
VLGATNCSVSFSLVMLGRSEAFSPSVSLLLFPNWIVISDLEYSNLNKYNLKFVTLNLDQCCLNFGTLYRGGSEDVASWTGEHDRNN